MTPQLHGARAGTERSGDGQLRSGWAKPALALRGRQSPPGLTRQPGGLGALPRSCGAPVALLGSADWQTAALLLRHARKSAPAGSGRRLASAEIRWGDALFRPRIKGRRWFEPSGRLDGIHTRITGLNSGILTSWTTRRRKIEPRGRRRRLTPVGRTAWLVPGRRPGV